MYGHRKMEGTILAFFAALLLVWGLYAGTAQIRLAVAAAVTKEEQKPAAPEPAVIAIPEPMEKAAPLPVAAEIDTLSPVSPSLEGSVTPKTNTAYQTTAYFLNVRERPSAKARILRVLEKDSFVEVTDAGENGWLALADGGYIHGDYAKPAEGGPAAQPQSVPAAAETPDDSPLKPTSAVRSDSGLSESHIAEILEGTELEGHELESVILEVEEDFGINAYFTIAVMKLESGNGTSRLAKIKNNLFGLNASGGNGYKKAFQFETKADSVRKFGVLIADKYIGKGYTTIEKVARKYCPANAKWAGLVKSIMSKDHDKL